MLQWITRLIEIARNLNRSFIQILCYITTRHPEEPRRKAVRLYFFTTVSQDEIGHIFGHDSWCVRTVTTVYCQELL